MVSAQLQPRQIVEEICSGDLTVYLLLKEHSGSVVCWWEGKAITNRVGFIKRKK